MRRPVLLVLLPLLVGVGAGASLVAIASPPPPTQSASSAGPTACARGPADMGDFADARGFPRFDFGAAGEYREFYFVRAMYSGGGGRRGGFFGRGGYGGLGDGGPSWSIDYANADRTIMMVARRLSNIDACEWEHPISLADPDLRRHPFIYSLEWGDARLTDEEVAGLRSYLEAGGLLMIDDFWGTGEWANFEREISRALPGYPIVEVPRDHLLFKIHYTIDGEIIQVPGFGGGYAGRETFQRDGYVAHVRGIFDDDGRLMVVINWNTDLGDALEHAENPYYPLPFSTFASELFLNIIMYSMSG